MTNKKTIRKHETHFITLIFFSFNIAFRLKITIDFLIEKLTEKNFIIIFINVYKTVIAIDTKNTT